MSEFKVGDRVRLKSKPEVEGTIYNVDVETVGVKFAERRCLATNAAYLRFTEELELVPRGPAWYVGKTVEFHHANGNRDRGHVIFTFYWDGLDFAVVGAYSSSDRWSPTVRIIYAIEVIE